MPTYNYQCSACKRFYQETADYREQRILSCCCNSIAIRRSGAAGMVAPPMPEQAVDVRELVKPEQEEGPIDGGIPFGTVPGDEDYMQEIGGKKIGDEGYIGPMP